MFPSKGSTDVPIYQIKITLDESKPPMWRRVLVRNDITLGELHDIIQAVMGWSGYHLHQFIVGETYYGEPHPDYDGFLEMRDDSRVKLNQIVTGEKFKFRYEYDFGDSWLHNLVVEKILPPEAGQQYPVCIKGKRACPPEDVGGIWGYYRFLEAIQDPDHPEHEDYLEWVARISTPKPLTWTKSMRRCVLCDEDKSTALNAKAHESKSGLQKMC